MGLSWSPSVAAPFIGELTWMTPLGAIPFALYMRAVMPPSLSQLSSS